MEDGRPSPTPPHRTVLTVLPYTARGRMFAIPADEGLLRPLEPPTRFGSGTPRRSFHRETRVTNPALSKYALVYLEFAAVVARLPNAHDRSLRLTQLSILPIWAT